MSDNILLTVFYDLGWNKNRSTCKKQALLDLVSISDIRYTHKSHCNIIHKDFFVKVLEAHAYLFETLNCIFLSTKKTAAHWLAASIISHNPEVIESIAVITF